ncbi:tRNA (adenosine(37)-N6)-threonylcarbamoyltransferase complex transferase subunit TsaD [Elioraea sp.]|uniref:tRNA (adenosine(37)-N6)-threonylcarbamoyltransferase complex transferase subunit TsaD n=1 Tax=Elioraea sp. TaxID=2185103 RepID=UPI003F70EEB1
MSSQGHGAVLGIETSCDETAAAVLDGAGRVLAERLWSQTEEHAAYAGVVPEIAARAHLARLPAMIEAVLAEAAVSPSAVAATAGPGLIGGLIVGANLGKGFALARRLPFYAVNHLEAHALSARLPGLAGEAPTFPYLTLLVSGGHCLLVETRGPGAHALLGRTLDDAPGEAFDKVAKMLGLGWPGGPALERLAAAGDPDRFALPRPMLGRAGFDFSFSGLKTAVATIVASYPAGALPERDAADLAAGFQARVAWTLADRARRAMRAAAGCHVLVVSGGVAANGVVREALRATAEAEGFRLAVPPPALCTDNAVMVAWAAIERRHAGDPGADLAVAPRPRWAL